MPPETRTLAKRSSRWIFVRGDVAFASAVRPSRSSSYSFLVQPAGGSQSSVSGSAVAWAFADSSFTLRSSDGFPPLGAAWSRSYVFPAPWLPSDRIYVAMEFDPRSSAGVYRHPRAGGLERVKLRFPGPYVLAPGGSITDVGSREVRLVTPDCEREGRADADSVRPAYP